mmetsp:Transcript_31141/g.73086  ORF Transcript_31141/g.73086 Transcript_31141/m.73086 type:complete len:207 (-) Transcript_31141:209-829(-)
MPKSGSLNVHHSVGDFQLGQSKAARKGHGPNRLDRHGQRHVLQVFAQAKQFIGNFSQPTLETVPVRVPGGALVQLNLRQGGATQKGSGTNGLHTVRHDNGPQRRAVLKGILTDTGHGRVFGQHLDGHERGATVKGAVPNADKNLAGDLDFHQEFATAKCLVRQRLHVRVDHGVHDIAAGLRFSLVPVPFFLSIESHKFIIECCQFG